METQELVEKLKQYPIAVGGVVLALILAGVLYWRLPALPELQDSVGAIEKDAEQIEQNKISAVDLEMHLEQAKELVSEVEGRLMDRKANTDNYRYFLRLEETTGVNMDDPVVSGYFDVGGPKGFKKAKDTAVYAQIGYRLNLRGKLEDVLNYIYALRTGPHFFIIDSLSLVPENKNTEATELVAANLSVRALAISEFNNKKQNKKK